MPFCKQCSKEISPDARFCPHCGYDQTALPAVPMVGLETKNTGLAAVLALIAGLFGFWGVGHIYVGKIGRGLALLVLGIIIGWVFGFLTLFGVIFGATFRYPGYRYGGLIVVGIVGGIIWFLIVLAIFIWQIYDAYSLAKYYNSYVQRYRKAPW